MEITYNDILPLIERYHIRLKSTSLKFVRYLYDRINWDARLIGIKGCRGVGKTTLLLQRIKKIHKNLNEAIYLALDDLWFASHSLEDLVAYLYRNGTREFYLDEVHKYPQWAKLIKNLYDFYPEIKIVYTGSALLAIDHSIADLSRRQSLYTMWGMSFREYLEYENILSMSPLTLDAILSDHVRIAMDLSEKTSILKSFGDYLRHGYYPFYKESGRDFPMRLSEVIRTVIETDIPQIEEISIHTVFKLRSLMMLMAENAPFEPNISKLSEKLECSRELCLKMLYMLDRAGLLRLLYHRPKTYKQMRGPEKVLGGDTNILSVLTDTTNKGTLRETFFANQMGNIGELELADRGDFRFDQRFIFEVGGPNKKFTQIADLPDSFLALDDIETGFGSRIPLYMFGLMY